MGVLQGVSGSNCCLGSPRCFLGQGAQAWPQGSRGAAFLLLGECTWAGSCHHAGTILGLSCSSSQAVASKLDLPDDLVGYFSLFLVRKTKDGAFSCE